MIKLSFAEREREGEREREREREREKPSLILFESRILIL